MREKALFLGPHGENLDTLVSLITEAIQDHAYWRRNFHPEDAVLIDEKSKSLDAYKDVVTSLRQEVFSMVQRLKADVPFHSLRYMAHMNADLLIPAIVGYVAAMLYNPNNVTSESSPVTTGMELKVGRDFARIFGFNPDTAWGHLTSCGTVANIEALWVARNLKYYPLAFRKAVAEDPECYKINLDQFGDTLSPDETLELRDGLCHALLRGRAPETLPHVCMSDELKKKMLRRIDEIVGRHTIQTRGWLAFQEEFGVRPAVILVPRTAHYSWAKAADLVGIGKGATVPVDIDENFRMRLPDLRGKLDKYGNNVVMVVAVAGSTEEGSFDDIAAIVEEREKRGFYLHIDAAYGGYLATTIWKNAKTGGPDSRAAFLSFMEVQPTSAEEYVHQTEHLYSALISFSKADSITVDPHKLGYIPYQAGGIAYRDKRVTEYIVSTAPYVFHSGTGQAFVGQYILEGSKAGATAAAVAISHRVVHLDQTGYGGILKRTVHGAFDLYRRLQELREVRSVKVVPIARPDSNIVCFTLNFHGNESLPKSNRLVDSVFDRFTTVHGRPLHDLDFVISKTEFGHAEYAGGATDALLGRMGIPVENLCAENQVERPDQDSKIQVLRMTVMNPWHLEETIPDRSSKKPPSDAPKQTSVEAFVEALKSVLRTHSPSVWVVEDDDADYCRLESLLTQVGSSREMRISRSADKEEALRVAAEEEKLGDMDLAVIDLDLPISKRDRQQDKGAGAVILEKVRSKRPELPVVIYTRFEESADLLNTLAFAGFRSRDGLLHKPCAVSRKPTGEDWTEDERRLREVNLYREVFERMDAGVR